MLITRHVLNHYATTAAYGSVPWKVFFNISSNGGRSQTVTRRSFCQERLIRFASLSAQPLSLHIFYFPLSHSLSLAHTRTLTPTLTHTHALSHTHAQEQMYALTGSHTRTHSFTPFNSRHADAAKDENKTNSPILFFCCLGFQSKSKKVHPMRASKFFPKNSGYRTWNLCCIAR